jgi:hypothetical protein
MDCDGIQLNSDREQAFLTKKIHFPRFLAGAIGHSSSDNDSVLLFDVARLATLSWYTRLVFRSF